MSDIEITRLCAEAMGWTFVEEGPSNNALWQRSVWTAARYEKDGKLIQWNYEWNPLHDDAQAMALVKKFHPSIGFNFCEKIYHTHIRISDSWGESPDLNRAICECVAKMQASK